MREITSHPAIADGRIECIGITVLAAEAGYSMPMFTPYVTPYCGMTGELRILLVNGKKNGILDEIFRISGNVIFPGYTIPTLRWLVENEPASLEKTSYNLYCKDLVRYKLTGRIALDRSDLAYMRLTFAKANCLKS